MRLLMMIVGLLVLSGCFWGSDQQEPERHVVVYSEGQERYTIIQHLENKGMNIQATLPSGQQDIQEVCERHAAAFFDGEDLEGFEQRWSQMEKEVREDAMGGAQAHQPFDQFELRWVRITMGSSQDATGCTIRESGIDYQ